MGLIGATADTDVPSWFATYVNSAFLFVASTMTILVVMTIFIRWTRKTDRDGLRWRDMDFGVDFMLGAFVSVPAAIGFRVAKVAAAHYSHQVVHHLTGARTSIELGLGLMISILFVTFYFARLDGRREANRHDAAKAAAKDNAERLAAEIAGGTTDVATMVEEALNTAHESTWKPGLRDIVLCVLIPDLVGMAAVAIALLYSSLGGRLVT